MNAELAALNHPGSAHIALDFHTGGIDLPTATRSLDAAVLFPSSSHS